jgi:hypothetical protein
VKRSIAKGEQSGEVRGDARELRRRGAAMLEEALSCGRHADVLFELDDGTLAELIGAHRAVMCAANKEFDAMFELGDGTELIGAHRAVMCAANKEFDAMFQDSLEEDKRGLVRIPLGVCASVVKGLLQWVYLGEWMGVTMTLKYVL